MTAPVVQPYDPMTDDVLAEHRVPNMIVHKPLETNSVIPACAIGSKEPMQRFGAVVLRLEMGSRCTRTGCWPKGTDR